jgi:hypothetical protein
MTAEMVSRTVSILACATTLSLLSTIITIGAVNAAALKWDGTFCVKKACSGVIANIGEASRLRPANIPRIGKTT